jgi:2-dehydropantoate 2-reductase
MAIKIDILGAGAMGSLFGGLLAQAGHSVRLLDVNPAQINAIQSNGLLIEANGETKRVHLPITLPEQATKAPEWLVVFTKTVQTTAALTSAKHLIGEQTRLLSVQNGLGNAEKLARFAPIERIAVGITMVPADLVRPGEVHMTGAGETHVTMASGAEDAALSALAAALCEAGLATSVDPHTEVLIWEKVAFNAALNAICAITRQPVGGVGGDPRGRKLAHAIAEEVLTVAAARGLDVSRPRVAGVINYALDHHSDHKPSMLQDILAGRPTEIDAINGAVAEIARQHSVPVPRTESLHTLISLATRRP